MYVCPLGCLLERFFTKEVIEIHKMEGEGKRRRLEDHTSTSDIEKANNSEDSKNHVMLQLQFDDREPRQTDQVQ